MMRRSLLVLALALATLPAAAQQAPVPDPPPHAEPLHEGVRVTLDLRIRPSADVEGLLPLDVIDLLAAQETLAELNVATAPGGGSHVHAAFHFASLDAFRTWYRDAATQSLFQDVDRGTNEVNVALHLRRLRQR